MTKDLITIQYAVYQTGHERSSVLEWNKHLRDNSVFTNR